MSKSLRCPGHQKPRDNNKSLTIPGSTMKISQLLPRFSLPLCALLLVGSLATQAFAQSNVYTINIVGYVNKPLPTGFSLIANPLNNTLPNGNTIVNLFNDSLNPNSVVQKWTGSIYASYTYLGLSQWIDQNNNPIGPVTIGAGEGAVVWNSGPIVTNTFVGQVEGYVDPGGRLPVPVPPSGIYLRGSIAPIGGSSFAEIMGRAPLDGDAVLKIDVLGNPLLSYFSSGEWHDPNGGNLAPTVEVAESAFFDTTGNQFAGFTLPSVASVPEPSALGLVLLSGLFGYRRFRSGH